MSRPQSTQDNANLAQDAYADRRPNPLDPDVNLDGVKYRVLEHFDRKSGYQGTIYQRVDTGQIIVAHRGTEGARDGLTDAGMVTNRVNDQLKDAYALTEKALIYAHGTELRTHQKVEVTTVGHSLGGTLAQATAYKYGLKGEAFNPYGAANLGLGIPAGGHDFHNYVMATDAVSSGARHFGDVTVYAKPDDIQRLRNFGYENREGGIMTHGGVLGLAAKSMGAHSISNFSNIDDKGQHHATVLNPECRELAQQNSIAIRHYRDDVYTARSALHLGLDGNPVEKIKGAIEDIRNGAKPDTPPRLMLNENDRPIFDRIRSGVPEQVTDQQVLQATADLRTAGLTNASSIDKMVMHNGAIFVTTDHTAGYAHSKTDVSGPAQDPTQSIDQINQVNQQQVQQNMAFQQQQQQAQAQSMSLG